MLRILRPHELKFLAMSLPGTAAAEAFNEMKTEWNGIGPVPNLERWLTGADKHGGKFEA